MKKLFGVAAVLMMLGPAAAIADQRAQLELIDPTAVQSHQPETSEACCRICRKGKACGNSCISRNKRCHQPPGCACDA